MYLNQNKLTKSEWMGIELPVDDSEKFVLTLIKEGYSNVSVRRNLNNSIISIIKLEYTPEIETFLYKTYLQDEIIQSVKKYAKLVKILNDAYVIPTIESKKKPNSKPRRDHSTAPLSSQNLFRSRS